MQAEKTWEETKVDQEIARIMQAGTAWAEMVDNGGSEEKARIMQTRETWAETNVDQEIARIMQAGTAGLKWLIVVVVKKKPESCKQEKHGPKQMLKKRPESCKQKRHGRKQRLTRK